MICRGTEYEVLSLAIRKNSLKLASKILKRPNAVIKDHNWTDYILLIKALQRGRRWIVRLLLKNNCRVNKPDKTNFYHTPLYYAVKLEDAQLVTSILNSGALINGRDYNKETPLTLAVKRKCFKIVDIFLSSYLRTPNMNKFNNDDFEALNVACIRNNESVVESLIKQGVSINQYLNPESQDESNCTPLHIAVKHQSINVIKVLLQHGASIEAKNGIGQTPMHMAFYMARSLYPSKSSLKIIDLLLFHLKKTLINLIDRSGLSYFHIACTRDQPDVVKHFLLCDVNVNSQVSFESLKFSGYTPLHFAIESKQKSIIDLLLNHGASTTIKNKNQETPFYFAFHHLYTEIQIFDSILTKFVPKNVNPSNNFGITHFHVACITSNVEAIEAFLQNDVEINAAVDLESSKCAGYTPLHFAVDFNSKKTVELLLQYGADVSLKDKEGFTPLHMACQQNAKKIFTILKNSASFTYEHEKKDYEKSFKQAPTKFLTSVAKQTDQMDIVDLLLEYHSDVNSQDYTGKTPMFYACEFDHQTFIFTFGRQMTQSLHFVMNEFCNRRSRIMTALLKHHANVNIYDNSRKTILHYVAEQEKPYNDYKKAEIAEILLDHGADVNARNETNSTPLHIALKKGIGELAEIFVKHIKDPNVAENENYYTPLHWATYNDLLAPKAEDIIKDLIKKGANPDCKDIEGKTPLHIAASTRYSTNRLSPLLDVDCDIDSQDLRERSALHMACLNRNVDNVQNLLIHGADINLEDSYGKTPFYYFYEFQNEILESRRLIFDFHQIYYLFKNHIRRLKVLDFFISTDNISYYLKLNDLHRQQVDNPDVDDVLIHCEYEVKKMKEIKLNTYSSLYDVLYKDPNQMAAYTKNNTLIDILKSSTFDRDFLQYGFLLKLQFNRGISRKKLLDPAKVSLKKLLGLNLPDLCAERIFRYLNNKHLKNLIVAEKLS